MSALGSVWDSLGMGIVGNEYFRSWDSSQTRFWMSVKPAQPSLSVGSTSTTVAAAMFVDNRCLVASVFHTMNPPETGLSSGLPSAIFQSQRRFSHKIFSGHSWFSIFKKIVLSREPRYFFSGQLFTHTLLTVRIHTTSGSQETLQWYYVYNNGQRHLVYWKTRRLLVSTWNDHERTPFVHLDLVNYTKVGPTYFHIPYIWWLSLLLLLL